MRYANLLLLAASLFLGRAFAQTAELSTDDISIYHDFLLHYPMPLRDLVGMQPATGEFSSMKNPHDPSLSGFNLLIPTQSGRKLPAEIMQLTSEEAVRRRAAKAGQVVRLTGHVRTHLKLSELAFDRGHTLALLVFSASCNCKGGDGGVAVYRHTDHGWHLEKVIDTWEG